MFDRYNITDERDIQSDGEKLAEYLEKKAESAKVRTELRIVPKLREIQNHQKTF